MAYVVFDTSEFSSVYSNINWAITGKIFNHIVKLKKKSKSVVDGPIVVAAGESFNMITDEK